MLGDFSFGGVSKQQACAWAFELITKEFKLPLDRLYFTVFTEDDETHDVWRSLGVAEDHISRLGEDDNFWAAGPTGPCGPCSEIYFDMGEEVGCGSPDCKPGCDCDRFLEFWNLVFTQYDRQEDGSMPELPHRNLDTGMGLERIASVIQNVPTNYDIDLFRNLMAAAKAAVEKAGATDVEPGTPSLKVIADHIRAITFMISDGILPSNEGRGYVLRRLLRRAARHGKLLGVNRPFLYEIVDTVVAVNECEYKDLREKQSYITKVIRTEEENFAKTIDGGMKIFSDMLAEHKAKGETKFSGEDAFKLYDTYGFPIDLTREMAADEGLSVDEEAFAKAMAEQKNRAREARKALGDLGWAGVEFGKDIPSTEFVGYDHDSIDDAKLVALVVEGEQAEEMMSGVEGIVVLDKTPFYAEMGGQVADHGVITCGDAKFEVADVQKNKGGKYMHTGKLTQGVLKVGGTVSASIDVKRRKAVMRAHSATHLLDAVLHQVLGDHVHQAGSLVEPDKLRFDFTHFAALTAEELSQVSALVNEAVLEGYEVSTEVLPIEEAKQRGAIALFGEKYGDTVRVVDMGQGFSVEFCGGTHLDNTAKVGVFHIDSEFSVASGVRRIEATTGLKSLETMNRAQSLLLETAAGLKAKPAELREKAEQNMAELREMRHTVEKFQAREAAGETERFLMGGHDLGELKVLTATLPNADAAKLRQMGDMLRDKQPNVVAVLSAVNDGKITFLAVCGKEAVSTGVKAGDIIKNVTTICGGKGGGKPDSAMGGGNDLLKLDDALAKVDDLVAEKLGL